MIQILLNSYIVVLTKIIGTKKATPEVKESVAQRIGGDKWGLLLPLLLVDIRRDRPEDFKMSGIVLDQVDTRKDGHFLI